MADNQPELVTINVDGQDVKVPKGVMLVEAAKAVAVEIPVFCYHPKLDPVGMCRMCLVETGSIAKDRATGEVQRDEQGNPIIQWLPKLMAACTTPASEGTYVRTATPRVADAWRGTLEFLLTSHPLDCPVCDKGGECPLQDLTFAYGPDMSRFYKRNKYHFEKPIPLGELIWLDRERCIYCARCVRFQEEVAGDPVLKFADRNRGQEIVTYSDPPFDSYFSGNTTDICPVGALTTEDFRFKARVWELTNVPSICNHCAVGCNSVLGTRTGEIKRVMPRQNEWVNEMWLCDKGRFGHHFVRAGDRLTRPLVRDNGQLREATWGEALRRVADRLAAILATHGSGAIGTLAGDRLANEDLYLLGRFTREVLGSPHIDSRLHWPTNTGIEEAVANVGLTSGSNLGDLGSGSVILAIGSNLEEEQPVTYLRARKAVQKGAQLVVVQARSVKEQRDATQSLHARAGSEAHVAAALLKGVAGLGTSDFGKLAGADELRAGLAALEDDALAAQTGLASSTLAALAETLAGATELVILVGREALVNAGSNAAALVESLVGLLVATGKAGQHNCGLVALWPHNNSQGAADMGALPHLAAGYEAVEPGATVDQMLSGKAGLHAMIVAAADPARDRPASVELLRGLDFLVVQELFLTETAQLADVVLPAAAFAERDGTFTNMERRVQRFQKAFEPPAEALPDWQIITRLAAQFESEWPSYFVAADVAAEIAKKVKLYKGFTYDKLRGEAVTWSTTAGGHHTFTGTSVPNSWFGLQWEVAAEARKPKFALRWRAPEALPAVQDGTLRLIPQRVLYDQGTMIARSELLDGRRTRPFVTLGPLDAGTLGVVEGELLALGAGELSIHAPLRVDAGLQPGTIVVPLDVHPAFNALAGAAQGTVTVRKAELAPA